MNVFNEVDLQRYKLRLSIKERLTEIMDRENTNAMKIKDEEETAEPIVQEMTFDDELAKMLRKEEEAHEQKQEEEDKKVKATIQATIGNIKKLNLSL